MTNQESLPDAVAPHPDEPRDDPSADGGPRTALDRAIGHASKGIAWLVLLATVISVFEVFMRYALNSPTSWVHETTVLLIAFIFALGGPVALARDKHIRVRILYDLAGPRLRFALDLFIELLTLVFTTGITYAAWVMFYVASHNPRGEIQFERSGTSWNPPIPAIIKFVILFSVAVMLLQTVMHIIHTLRQGPVRPEEK